MRPAASALGFRRHPTGMGGALCSTSVHFRPQHRRGCRRHALLVTLTAVVLSFTSLVSPPAAPALSPFPAQFVAKTYTEALGRMPDQGGWNHAKGQFPSCSVSTLKNWGTTVWEVVPVVVEFEVAVPRSRPASW
jgi:hypothetical protein